MKRNRESYRQTNMKNKKTEREKEKHEKKQKVRERERERDKHEDVMTSFPDVVVVVAVPIQI